MTCWPRRCGAKRDPRRDRAVYCICHTATPGRTAIAKGANQFVNSTASNDFGPVTSDCDGLFFRLKKLLVVALTAY
jgi:hypothetical protein